MTYRKYKEAVQTEKDSLEILEETSDKELKELAQIELDEAKNNIKKTCGRFENPAFAEGSER